MYYYSKRSRSKIVHQSTCQHIQNVSVEDAGSFENLEDAYAAGYRLCRHCSPIAKLYRKESDVTRFSSLLHQNVYRVYRQRQGAVGVFCFQRHLVSIKCSGGLKVTRENERIPPYRT